MHNRFFSRRIQTVFSICDAQVLNDSKFIKSISLKASKLLDLGTMKSVFYLFNPSGITCVVLLSRAQLTVSTNATTYTTTTDIFTDYYRANFEDFLEYLSKNLQSKNHVLNEVNNDNFSFSNNKTEASHDIANWLLRSNEPSGTFISILGSCGGVAKSVLSILNKACTDKNDPIHKFISSCKLHLIDVSQKNMDYYSNKFPNLKDKISLYKFDLTDLERFTTHLKETRTNIVIDISFADTVDMLHCCNDLGVMYINSALESVSVDENEDLEGFPLQERFNIFESNRNKFKNITSIVCSGMNPGVVQWMAIELMKKNPHKSPIACYIVEEDTSFFENEKLADINTLYTTWSTECFLDEAIYSYPTYMKKHKSIFLYNEVYELEFKVSLGDKSFYGCLMPHEEAITLGKMYDMETGFIYKVNDHTTNLIKDNLKDVDVLWEKPMEVLNPETTPLKGEDLVGVLLVYDDKEIFMYNVLSNKEIYKKYKTNATYHQVASGVYGALATILLDNIPAGIYYVDELLVNTNNNYGKYISYHIGNFITGENNYSEGDLLNRMKS